ncbi:MAG TPA: UvrD-helicase domain-containing protein, partial [Candidatus Methylomirabilis sp.]|nr:UvrD-helicase domain-containing protein [Candidatus Methylomirabilis sp.]
MHPSGILDDLNPAQREAVLHTEGPLLILAGAGSGKTRVITRRIAHLIDGCGVRPGSILAVTFTNKAAGEMRGRVERLLGAGVLGVWVGTFHATCVRILRRNARLLGIRESFVIYDEGDQLSLMKASLNDLDFGERVLNPRVSLARISRAKNELLSPAEYAAEAADFTEERVAKAYYRYQERLLQSGALDFDDLLMQTVRLFEEHPTVLAAYQTLWRYLMVDEYQDTNHAQYRLVRLLAAAHQNLAVVGDDDQSIYRFRGADFRNILDFERDYPTCRVVRLEQNYRSTQVILDAAHGVISKNLDRKAKRLWTERAGGEPVVLFQGRDEEEEAEFVARTIGRSAVEEGASLDDFAVFYRVNAQSRALEDALRRHVLPYVIVGGVRFYERKEVKDALAYLRLIASSADSVSFLRAIGVPPRGLGKGALEKLEQVAAAQRCSLWEACGRQELLDALSARQRKALQEFITLIERLRAKVAEFPLPDLIQAVLDESGLVAALREEGTPEAEGRLENLRELAVAAQDFMLR